MAGLNKLFNSGFSNKDIVTLAKIAENQFLSSPCGFLDQMAVVFSKKNNLMYLDFKDLSFQYVKIDDNYKFIVIDSKIKHSIAGSGYSTRIKEKQRIEEIIKRKTSLELRDFIENIISENSIIIDRFIQESNLSGSLEFHEKNKLCDILKEFINNPELLKRLIHFITEIYRVNKIKEYFSINEYEKGYNLLWSSHFSLSKYYEVSVSEIDFIVQCLYNSKLFIGARIIGGGFGGSILAVINKDVSENKIKDYLNNLNGEYIKRFSLKFDYYFMETSDGIINV